MVKLVAPIIKTERIILRVPTLADLNKFQCAKEEVWPELQNWMSWASDDQKDIGKAREFFTLNSGLRDDGSAALLGFDSVTNDFVMASGFDRVGEDEYSTGYWVAKNYLGKGYATEATNGIIHYLFNALNAKAVHINYYEGNEKSRRIVEKLGFEFVETKADYHTQFSTGEKLASHNYILHDGNNLPDQQTMWIRPFRKEEWQNFRTKRLQALKELPHLFSAGYDEAITKPDSFWLDMLTSHKGQVFGLFDGPQLIGITGIFENWNDKSGATAHLCMSFIDSEYRGKNLSALLYQARIDWAKIKGFKKITVGHREGNEASKAANQKFGFQFYEKEEIDFPDGRAMDYRYELKL